MFLTGVVPLKRAPNISVAAMPVLLNCDFCSNLSYFYLPVLSAAPATAPSPAPPPAAAVTTTPTTTTTTATTATTTTTTTPTPTTTLLH